MQPAAPPPLDFFAHCPRCGAAASRPEPGAKAFGCDACGFRVYFNVGTATLAVIENARGEVLFLRRARDPGAGKLGFPGGFADPDESAEEGLRREIREEAGLEVGELTYLCSCPNRYPYRGVLYPTLDLAFHARVAEGAEALTLEAGEVAGGEWKDPSTVDPDEMAFPSARAALRLHLSLQRTGRTSA